MAKSRLKGDLNIVFFTHVAQTNAASSVCKLISVTGMSVTHLNTVQKHTIVKRQLLYQDGL